MLKPLLLKKPLSVWQRRCRRYWPLALGLFFLILILILLSPCLFRSWTHYPEALRAEIAWRHFRASFQGTCREECLATRQAYASLWRPYYQAHPEAAVNNFRQVFQSGDADLQAALIKIMAVDNNSQILPPLLAEIIADPQASVENKRLIVTFFPAFFKDESWLAQIRAQVETENVALADRIYALRLLASFPQADNAALVKKLILNQTETELLTAALQIASSWPEGAINWPASDLENLTVLIKKEPFGPGRWRRLWLLSEVGKNQPEILQSLLASLAGATDLDNLSRSLAAETLRTLFALDIKTPDPSAQEWQNFYAAL